MQWLPRPRFLFPDQLPAPVDQELFWINDIIQSAMVLLTLLRQVLFLLCASAATGFGIASSYRANRCRSTTLAARNGGDLTIYGHPGTRSPLVNWACHEMGVPFRMGKVANNPHPFQQLPCLSDSNGVVVFESGAILQYLLDTYSDDALSLADRAQATSWIYWANASFDPICFLETPEGKVYDTGLRQPNAHVDELDSILKKQEWLLGDMFSLADIAVASYGLYVILFFPQVSIASRWPSLARYLLRSAERPAYSKAFGSDCQAQLITVLQNDLKRQ